MASVTHRIKSVQQPYGGYLPIKHFNKRILEDGNTLNEAENISAGLVGIAVDYLTRFMLGNTVDQAFHISSLGAKLIGMQHIATELKAQVTGLDNASITAACKLAGFDVCYRASVSGYRPVENISPDQATIENIRIMVNRSMRFWNQYGPVVCSEPTFEGGYSAIIDTGDGDYVTQDTLWDFKVTKTAPTSKHTLQILVYYIMGMHSIHDYYKSITQLGFFNPRLNTVYTYSIADISSEVIKEVEEQVIGYGMPLSRTIQHTTVSQQNETHENDYSVADICAMTGLSKNAVYSEIRSGRLTAYKKGNKYMVSRDEYNRYMAYLEEQRKLQTTIVLAIGAVGLIFLIVVLIFLSL